MKLSRIPHTSEEEYRILRRVHFRADETRQGKTVQILVDLNRCQSYGQCVFAAPAVFRMEHDETLEWDYLPNPAEEHRVVRAMHACPVQAISLDSTLNA